MQYSEELNKLFIDMGKPVQVGFSAGVSPPGGLLIRGLPVYAEATYVKDPVKRCPNHASLSDASNKDFPKEFVDHLIRVNHDAVVYERDEVSERLSVVMPFESPQVGYGTLLYSCMTALVKPCLLFGHILMSVPSKILLYLK